MIRESVDDALSTASGDLICDYCHSAVKQVHETIEYIFICDTCADKLDEGQEIRIYNN